MLLLPAFFGSDTITEYIGGVVPPPPGPGGPEFDFTGGTIPQGVAKNTPANSGRWDNSSTPQFETGVDRFEYNRENNSELYGLLFESAATNLVGASDYRNVGSSNWSKTGISVSGVTGIDGSASAASRLTATQDSAIATLAVSGLTAGQEYTLSFFAKRAIGYGHAWFTTDGGTTWIKFAQQVTGKDNWTQKSDYASVFTATGTSATIGVAIQRNGDAFDFDYFQLEQGVVATTAIPGGATREADTMQLTINEGTWTFEWPTQAILFGEQYLRKVTVTYTSGSNANVSIEVHNRFAELNYTYDLDGVTLT